MYDVIAQLDGYEAIARAFGAKAADESHRARLRDVLETAIAFYHQVLTTTSLGKPALDYLRGRGFTDAEDLPNGPRVVMISEALWRNGFGGDRGCRGGTQPAGCAARQGRRRR